MMRPADAAHTNPQPGVEPIPCSICGKPSGGWVYTYLTDEEGHEVVEAYSACEVHRLEVIPEAESQAG